MRILEAKNIQKAFTYPSRVDVLRGVDLLVELGETIAIMGRSGEGKTTLLNILGTLERPDKGMLKIGGEETTRFNRAGIRNQNIGFIFQAFHLLLDYSALENILMPAKIARQNTGKGSEKYDKACALLESVGLADRRFHSAKLLSGGEKQRVAIARALMNDPDILLADEPSGNLDHQTAMQIQEILFDFVEKEKRALIVVTHDEELANRCERRFRLSDGILIQE